MEVSTITTTENNTISSGLQASTITSTTTNSQLFSNDNNLQSHTQKSTTNHSSINMKESIEESNNPTNNNTNRNKTWKDETLVGTNNCHDESNIMETTVIENTQPIPEQSNMKLELDYNEAELEHQVKLTIEALVERIIVLFEYVPIVTATTSQSTLLCSADEAITKVALITPVVIEEDASVTKDIITLRNLEITPPPQQFNDITPTTTATTTPDVQQCTSVTKSNRKRKGDRTLSETTEQSESACSRSKRQRKQTELFQVGDEKTTPKRQPAIVQDRSSLVKKASSSKKVQSKIPRFQPQKPSKPIERQKPAQPTQPSPIPPQQLPQPQISQDYQDVICYEKHDYLAIRNEEQTFYLCQLTENVRVQRPFIKVRWLDTQDNGKTYFLTSHYDKIPQKSIIMPVMLNKLRSEKKNQQIFSIDDDIRGLVMDRLKRSLNIQTE